MNTEGNGHRTITFTDELRQPSADQDHQPPPPPPDEDNEGEDPELVKHALESEIITESRRFEPPRSLLLDQSGGNSGDVGTEAGKSSQSVIKIKRQETNDIGVFDFDINFDLDELEDIVDYSVYENRTGLAEDMKFLASMPELCDITFLVGKERLVFRLASGREIMPNLTSS